MEYEKMLDRLYLSLPEGALNKERFEMPRAESFIQGNKTIVKNFGQILKLLGVEEKHLLKYVTKESATSAVIEEGRLTFNGKFNNILINKFFNSYLNQFVLCHECSKPDTTIVEVSGIKMLKCDACGATRPIKKV